MLGVPSAIAAAPTLAVTPLLAQFNHRPATADEVLSPYVYVFYASFLVAFLFTPVMRAVAAYYRIIDQPDRLRKTHLQPVAYLGGIAVFLGWLCGLAVSTFLRIHRVDVGWTNASPVIPYGIVVGALIIVLLGLWDDVFGVKPKGKILFQVLAAVVLLVNDIGIRSTQPLLEPLLGIFVRFGLLAPLDMNHPPGWFDPLVLVSSSLLVVFVIVGCCNATNLMDGMDGLCGGVTAIIAAGFLFVAVHLAMFGGGINTNWDALRVILGLALLGAVLGFIPYNFNPASIFMGDTGSMFLGFCCGTMIILMAQERPRWFLASMVMFALPVLDTSLAFARRWLAGRPLFSADAQHFHHQLVQRGYTVKQTVMISYGLAVMFALLGAAIVYTRTRYAVAIYLVTFGSIIVAAYKMGMVHERQRTGPASKLGDEGADVATSSPSSGDVFEIPDGTGGEMGSTHAVEPTATPAAAPAESRPGTRLVPPVA